MLGLGCEEVRDFRHTDDKTRTLETDLCSVAQD